MVMKSITKDDGPKAIPLIYATRRDLYEGFQDV